MTTTKGEATRAHILSRALAMASTLGLEGLSIAAVAQQAGMSKSGLFAHFESKEDMQLQVLATARERFVERVVAPALEKPRGEPRLRAFFERWLSWEDAGDLPGGCPYIVFAAELDDRPGPLRDALASAQKDWMEALATAGRIAVDEGHFRDDLDVDQLAYELYSIILAYHHFHRLLRDPRARERATRAFENLVQHCRRQG